MPTSTPIIVRPALTSDGPTLFLLALAFATSFAAERPAFDLALAELLAQPDAYLAVAEENGAVIGYVLGFAHWTFFANGRVAWVEEITVAETHQRRGGGRRLMTAFEAWAVSREAKLVALATRRASEFYRALGYVESAAYLRKRL